MLPTTRRTAECAVLPGLDRPVELGERDSQRQGPPTLHVPIEQINRELGWLAEHDVPGLLRMARRLAALVVAQQQQQRLLAWFAYHDPLTGLPNLLLFRDRLNQAIRRAERNQQIIAVIYLDVDHFKEINDTLGHAAGDAVLCEVAQRLECCIRQTDTVARLGGDEFGLILSDLDSAFGASRVVDIIQAAFSEPVMALDQPWQVTLSMGLCFYPTDTTCMEELLRRADQAMYRIKSLHHEMAAHTA